MCFGGIFFLKFAVGIISCEEGNLRFLQKMCRIILTETNETVVAKCVAHVTFAMETSYRIYTGVPASSIACSTFVNV